MQSFVSIYYFVFGVVTVLGGVYGYIRKKSKASLIAGFLCGLALIFCSLWMGREILIAVLSALTVCFVLFLRFFKVWLRVRKTMPYIPMVVLSLVGIVIGVLVLLRAV